MTRRRAYPSDLTDAQWAIIEALLPPPRRGGRPEKHPRRQIVDAILYVVRTGCSWRQLPSDFPPWQTVYWYFVAWEDQGVTQGSFKVGVTAWRRGDTPVWVYKPGGHGVFLDRGGWLTSTAIEWEPRRARLCIFPPPGR